MTKYLKKAETDRKSRNDRRKTEKPSKSRKGGSFVQIQNLKIFRSQHGQYSGGPALKHKSFDCSVLCLLEQFNNL